jgi:hypothetical protein
MRLINCSSIQLIGGNKLLALAAAAGDNPFPPQLQRTYKKALCYRPLSTVDPSQTRGRCRKTPACRFSPLASAFAPAKNRKQGERRNLFVDRLILTDHFLLHRSSNCEQQPHEAILSNGTLTHYLKAEALNLVEVQPSSLRAHVVSRDACNCLVAEVREKWCTLQTLRARVQEKTSWEGGQHALATWCCGPCRTQALFLRA